METNTSQLFSVIANDIKNDVIDYSWKLKHGLVSSIEEFLYDPVPSDVGVILLKIVVTDNVPGNDPDTVTWNIEVIEAGFRFHLRSIWKVHLTDPKCKPSSIRKD